MTNEFNFQKLAMFLKNFWGVLASFTLAIPSLLYFSNSQQLKTSVLGDYYFIIPSVFSLLAIPITFLYEKQFSNIAPTRKVAMILFFTSIICVFCFLFIKSFYVTNRTYSVRGEGGWTKTDYLESKDGNVIINYYNSGEDKPFRKDEKVNGFEFLSLIVYSISIVTLTASFSALGVFFYTKAPKEIEA